MADRRSKDVVVLEEPMVKTMIIHRKCPTLWMQIIKEIKPFIRCHINTYFDEMSQVPNPWLPEQSPMPDPSMPTQSTPMVSKNPPSRGTFRLMELPIELIIDIFEWVFGGYDLVAYLHHYPSSHSVLLFDHPRTWKSMKIFHICKKLRSLAIDKYGEPHQLALPFNPLLDRLVISQLIETREANELVGRDPDYPSWTLPYRKQERYEIRNGVHCCKWGPTVSQDAAHECVGFLNRIRYMETSVLTKPIIGSRVEPWGYKAWTFTLRCLSNLLPNLETLEVSVSHWPNCVGVGMETFSPNIYNSKAMAFFDGFRYAATADPQNDFSHESPTPKLAREPFPRLKKFIVVKVPNRNTLVVSPAFTGPGEEHFHGQWAYDAGFPDEWFWDRHFNS